MLFIYNFLSRCDISMPDEDIQASHIEEAVDTDRVEPEFDGLIKQDEPSILQVPDKLEDISNDLLFRFDFFMAYWVCFNNSEDIFKYGRYCEDLK
jgi:hypothetical protein